MHIHLGIVDAITAFAYVLIIGFFWRIIAAHNHENAFGRAMSFIY